MLGILGGMSPAATVELMRQMSGAPPADRTNSIFPLSYAPIRVCRVLPTQFFRRRIARARDDPGVRELEARKANALRSRARRTSLVRRIDQCNAPADNSYCRRGLRHARDTGGAGKCGGTDCGTPTLRSGFYVEKLAAKQWPCVVLPIADNRDLVDPAIKLVKGNQPERAAPMFARPLKRCAAPARRRYPPHARNSNRPCAGAKERGRDMRGRHRSPGQGLRCVVAFARRRTARARSSGR